MDNNRFIGFTLIMLLILTYYTFFPPGQLQESEKPIFKKLAKSIVTLVDIKKDQIITAEMLTTKGPGSGVSPTRFNEIVGKKLNKDLSLDVVIKDEDVVWG